MCFSASASFIASGAIGALGVATLREARTAREIPLASVPLLFGVQQLIEGLIWLSFREGSPLPNTILTFIYSLFSHVLWPIFVPFAVSRLETVPWRRNALAASQIAGVAVGLYLLYFIVQFAVTSRVVDEHIVYDSPHFYAIAVMLLYVFGACGGCLLSSSRIIQAFGALLLATFIAAYVIHAAALFSMWCFFAAVLSAMLFFHFRGRRFAELAPNV